MCEVGSCCGCICLYKGSLIIGIISILAAISQLSVFSLILYTTYDSTNSANSSTLKNITAEKESSPFYSFTSNALSCPFGFIPLAVKDNSSDVVTDEPDDNEIELTTTENTNFKFSPVFNVSVTRTHSCLAPPQGVLWALVIASVLYIPVGIVLMIGVKKGISCMLSTWFFYTVGYNLLALIIALTDGVYVGAGDISSYVVCLITAYCIIIVDSYYEKLLRTEKEEGSSMKEQTRPSLVLAKSTPVSPNSSESPTTYATPMSKLATPPPGYAPCAAAELLLPPDCNLRPTSPV